MNKAELVGELSLESGVSKTDSEAVLNAFTKVVTDALSRGEKVQLVGFGTFETSERSARTGRNPATGESIQIPASTVPKFSAGKSLKEAVNR